MDLRVLLVVKGHYEDASMMQRRICDILFPGKAYDGRPTWQNVQWISMRLMTKGYIWEKASFRKQ